MRKVLMGAAAAAAVSLPAAANAQFKSINIESGKPLRLKASGVDLPATIAGLPRTGAVAYSDDLLNVSTEYRSADDGDVVSVYVFRDVVGDGPVWFDRARYAILNLGNRYPGATSSGIRTFTPRGQKVATGLMEVFTTGGTYRSTGVMLFPFNGFYGKLRVSSRTRDAAQLEQLMWSAAASIEWKSRAQEALAVPVADCSARLAASDSAAAVVQSSEDRMMSAMLGGLIGQVVASGKTTPVAGQYCREPGTARPAFAQYRFNQSADSYILTLGDTGNGLTVQPNSLLAIVNKEEGKPKTYSVSLVEMARTTSYADLDSLPTAERLVAHVESGKPISSSTTWGKRSNVNIYTDK